MNILVRVPKASTEHFWEAYEADYELEEFWNLSKKPKKLKIGDYIYFQIFDKIVAKAKVSRIEVSDETCLSTERVWSGCQVYWNEEDFERIEPMTGTKLTRGFQYIEVQSESEYKKDFKG